MTKEEKMSQLELIACDDPEYQLWVADHEILLKQFDRIIKWLPKRARKYVCEYVRCEQMMLYRMTELACIHMEFPEENGNPLFPEQVTEER